MDYIENLEALIAEHAAIITTPLPAHVHVCDGEGLWCYGSKGECVLNP